MSSPVREWIRTTALVSFDKLYELERYYSKICMFTSMWYASIGPLHFRLSIKGSFPMCPTASRCTSLYDEGYSNPYVLQVTLFPTPLKLARVLAPKGSNLHARSSTERRHFNSGAHRWEVLVATILGTDFAVANAAVVLREKQMKIFYGQPGQMDTISNRIQVRSEASQRHITSTYYLPILTCSFSMTNINEAAFSQSCLRNQI